MELFTLPCYWCGADPKPFNGIDRQNNERYYRKSNALPCCWECNRMKRALTAKQWLAFCNRIGLMTRVRFRRRAIALHEGCEPVEFLVNRKKVPQKATFALAAGQ
jgi:hypothetical protein